MTNEEELEMLSDNHDSQNEFVIEDTELHENVLTNSLDLANLDYCCDDDVSQTSALNRPLDKGLAKWAVKSSIPHAKIKTLLEVLIENGIDLPNDPRTLLKTPRSSDVKMFENGEYKHYGILGQIEKILSNKPCDFEILKLNFNVDDVPINDLGKLKVILGNIEGLTGVFLIGAYKVFTNSENQDDSNEILIDFVDEVNLLITYGIYFDNKWFAFELHKCICDAVAKAAIFKTKGHTGYFSCTKCWIRGQRKNGRTYFKDNNAAKRSDEEGAELSNSILKRIKNIKMITNTPLDYMHLVCLGVTKKLLIFFFKKTKTHLGSNVRNSINEALKTYKKFCPCDFVRKPDGLKYVHKWKATQYRQFLLYLGIVCLYKVVPENIYKMFLRLSIAIRIFVSGLRDLYDIAHQSLKKFNKRFERIYGKEHLSHNFHNLIHLKSDVEAHGPLDNFSSFQYENYMQTILKSIRKPAHVLQQIGNRLAEESNADINVHQKKFKRRKRVNGPNIDGIVGVQFSYYKHNDFIINTRSLGDSCFMLNDKIVVIENVIKDFRSHSITVVGREFRRKSDFFDEGLNSSVLNIYKCTKLSSLKSYDINAITSKMFRLPLRPAVFIVIPIAHFEEKEYQ